MSVVINPVSIDRVIGSADTLNNDTGTYRTVNIHVNDVPTVIGGGAGSAVVTTVTFTPALPASVLTYKVHVTPNQDAVPFVTLKANTGFTFTLNPRLAANTLAVGKNDIFISYDM